ncbi:hypothetical protein MSAN_01913700 [Mycena sanguinolenta]|uniref:Uncharacterized protein n=1 Tax=Mycena sanguinolenta TaxID=230812 RepID=A0A8H6XMB3_9AGAR|nr:hypothetical protein MSAN_01913700 [Mycena sanguinolenta]
MALSTKELLERSRRKRANRENPPPTSSTPSSPSLPPTPGLQPLPPLFNLNSTPAPGSTALSIRGTSMVQLKNFGERELKRIKLEPSTESNFRTYLATTSKDERDAMQAIWTLRVWDQLNWLTQNTAEAWTPSAGLEKAAHRNIYSLLLLPNVQLYAGTVGDIVLAAMRAVGTADLPDADSIHVDELITWLGEEVSQARYAIKRKIIDNARSNVADMAAELFSITHARYVPHTLGLYMHLALLRRLLGLKHSVNTFWGKVDDEMEEFRKGGSQAFVDLMEDIYEDDVRDFKDPSTTEHVLKSFSDPSFVCPQWLRELHKLAPQVKCLPKQKSKKCKRVVPEDDAGDDETPNNLSHHDENQIPEADDQLPESEEASGAGQELEES